MIKQLPARLAGLPRLPLALLVLLAATTFWLNQVVQPPATVEDSGSHRDPDYVLEGLSVIRMDDHGVARYTLFAKKMLHYPNDDRTPQVSDDDRTPRVPYGDCTPPAATPSRATSPPSALAGPVTNSIANPEKPVVRIETDQVELYGSSDDAYFSGNVTLLLNKANDSSKTAIVTSSLHAILNDDIVKTDKPVTITKGNATINAVGMELDNRNCVTYLSSQVKVVHDKKR